ncbi:unnamed protein product [Rotaria magnacalcarata]
MLIVELDSLSVKRDTPSSLSNLHHQTANASTNTPIHENLCLSPFLTSPMTNKSASTELGAISRALRLASASSSSSSSLTATINSANLPSKINKTSSNVTPQDASPFNFLLRSEINQESVPSVEKKTLIEISSSLSIDTSRFCRFIFPDQTSAILLTFNCTNNYTQYRPMTK